MLCTELLSEKDRVLVDGAEKSNENEAESIQKGDLKSKSVKLKGQNKNRPPPMRFDIAERICPSLVDVAVDEEPSACPYNPNCRYRHDVVEYMKERKPDVLPGGCPNYQSTGRCSRGISCLFGEEHVTPEGRNKENPSPNGPDSQYYNFLSKDLQKSLRKKTYNFKKAEDIVKKNNKNQPKDEVNKDSKNGVDETETELVAEEPCAKKIKVDVGPIMDEDVIRLKPEEKKKVFDNMLFN